mmetsp:Transcript_3821/g.4485  ORF Transcript_3821/g.4485 Transcript_3821/m.4485 type:complete len:202 (+) Transcript_3821:229-834(+)
MTSNILHHCQHYSMYRSALVRRQTLEILQAGFRILHGYDEELLPLINLVWPSIISNLKQEQNESVLAACFGTIDVAIDCGGKFMESRFIDDVWEQTGKILDSLINVQKKSKLSAFSKELCLSILRCLCTATLRLPRLASELYGKLAKLAAEFKQAEDVNLSLEAERLWNQIGEKNPELVWYLDAEFSTIRTPPHFLLRPLA